MAVFLRQQGQGVSFCLTFQILRKTPAEKGFFELNEWEAHLYHSFISSSLYRVRCLQVNYPSKDSDLCLPCDILDALTPDVQNVLGCEAVFLFFLLLSRSYWKLYHIFLFLHHIDIFWLLSQIYCLFLCSNIPLSRCMRAPYEQKWEWAVHDCSCTRCARLALHQMQVSQSRCRSVTADYLSSPSASCSTCSLHLQCLAFSPTSTCKKNQLSSNLHIGLLNF